MNLWQKIFGTLWKNRRVQPYAASPTTEQIENARMILSFAGSEGWNKYSEYLYISLGEAMEQAFSSLKKGDATTVMVWVSRAEAIYSLLTEPESAKSIVQKANQVIITPPRRHENVQG